MNKLIDQLLDTSVLDIVRKIKKLATIKSGYPRIKPVIPQFDNVRFSGKLVCGKEPEDFRDFQRVEAVSNWAQDRGVQFEVVKPEHFASISWNDVNAVWMPFLNPGENKDYETRCKEMLAIPEHVPLILDIKAFSNHPWIRPIREYLNQRRLACRHVSPSKTEELFQVKVQYTHWPVDLPHSDVKDVIMIDIHNWEDLSRHIQVLRLLEYFGQSYDTACNTAGWRLKFFLTSFTRLDPYLSAITDFITNDYGDHNSNGSIDNPLSIVRDNLIPPAETREDFLKVLSRTRLFVTFHNNLTDMDLFEALANEIPTAITSNSLTGEAIRNLWVPNRYEVAGFETWVHTVESNLISINGKNFNFLKKTWPSINSKEILRSVFCHSWDTLWKWVAGLESNGSK